MVAEPHSEAQDAAHQESRHSPVGPFSLAVPAAAQEKPGEFLKVS